MTPNPHNAACIGWTVTAASFGFALIQLDVTIVNVALPELARALHTGTEGLQWIVDAYALVFASLLLSGGFLGDRFGPKRVYLAGMGIFGIASLACGLAPDALVLSVARAAQGVGAAAMLPCSLALINHAAGHDTRLRAWAIGWWTAAGAVTIAAGPPIGGLLLSVFNWRSIFLVNLPICAIGVYFMRNVADNRVAPARRGFDLAGQTSAILAMLTLTGAVIEAKPLGLLHPVVLAAIGVAALSICAFVYIERHSAAPMLPLQLFTRESFTPAVLYGVIANSTYYGIVFVLSLYLQTVAGYSSTRAGLAYIPLTATFFFVNLISGWWVGRTGSRTPMIAGALIDACGFAILIVLSAHSAYWLMLPAFVLMPAGMGLGVPAMTTAVLAGVPKNQSGVASGVLNAARQAGGAMGVALFGAMASGNDAAIVHGLHGSAAIACLCLLIAAATAAWGIRRTPK